MGRDTCTFTSETVTVFRDNGGRETTCTKFLYKKDSSFMFPVVCKSSLVM